METKRGFNSLAVNSDVILALGVVAVLLVMIIPVPTAIIDVLLTLNISCSLLLLMVALSAARSREFSTFPSLLLFTTLFRLSLNVASTRLILLNGYAGEVINAFGHFVVGGNMVVGLVIFLILIVIQFVVITKGSGRISEVAARFTLDAMPGKQMAIDADLNAGLINETDARRRRDAISQEAEFYGAMDGASKFVRGDAIAGIIITAINLVGGIIIGKLHGMAVGDAVSTYSILTVGDGLVTQIPSLIIATTAGIIVTKSSSSTNLARDVAGEILTHPRSLALAAGILAFFGIVPGLPTVPFFILALIFGGMAVASRQARSQRAQDEAAAAVAAEPDAPADESVRTAQVDRMAIEVGYQLIPLLDPNESDETLRKIKAIRQKVADDLGILVPPIRIHDNLQLPADAYVIRLRGHEIARGRLRADHLLAIDSGMVAKAIEGEETAEPAFGLPATWIRPSLKDEAESAGYTVADPRSVLVTHLTEVVRKHASELLSREDVRVMVDRLKEESPTVVEELIPNVMTLGGVQKILRRLLVEGIPLTDFGGIVEAIADHAAATKDVDLLTERVRKSISRTICASVAGRGSVGAITLDPSVEQMIAQSIQEEGGEGAMFLEPGRSERFMQNLAEAVRSTVAGGFEAVLLTSAPIRRHVRRIVEHIIPTLPVLAYDELVPELQIEGREAVTLEEIPA